MKEPPPIIFNTERLILKACSIGDTKSLFMNYTGDKDSSEFLQREVHKSTAQTELFIQEWGIDSWKKNKGKFSWSIQKKNNPDTFGLFLVILKNTDAEIHFGIGHKMWGHGYATEAGLSIIRWIKERTEIQTVSTFCDLKNFPALRVLEKIGLHKKECLKNYMVAPLQGTKKRDVYIYSWNRDIQKYMRQ